MTYPIIALPYDAPYQLEQLGTKAKFWFRNEDDQQILFKVGRPGTGENWAEKVCSEVCRLIGLPHAVYDLATWKEFKGVVTESFVPPNGRLVFGNELLSKLVNDYDHGKRYQARQHTVRLVMTVLGGTMLPLGWLSPDGSINSSASLFVGYLMLDALVGNQDRHHENWGVIWLPERGVFFAPTFDHASSLGRNEQDHVRNEILTTKDQGRSIAAYAQRARSALFASPNDAKPLKTLEAFNEAAKIRPQAAEFWLNRLSDITQQDFDLILNEIPDSEISPTAKVFASKIFEINRQRLMNLEIR